MSHNPYELRVRDVMVTDVVTVTPDVTLHECIQRMFENRVSFLPIVGKHEECLGILSTTDLMEITQEIDEDLAVLECADLVTSRWLLERLTASTGHTKVSDVMSEDVFTVTADARLAHAGREMLRNGIHRMPVVDARRRIVGIVSTTDILSAFVDGEPEK